MLARQTPYQVSHIQAHLQQLLTVFATRQSQVLHGSRDPEDKDNQDRITLALRPY